MGRLARIAVYPIKSLDLHDRRRVRISDAGGLTGDREYVISDRSGSPITGKRTPAVHRLRATVDRAGRTVELRSVADDGPRARTFQFPGDREAVDRYLTNHFGVSASLRRSPRPGMTDRDDPGPTVVARATLETVADWFPEIDVEELTRRLRPNLVVAGVEPFWEDRLVPDGRLRIGEVRLDGGDPIPRCVVPTRNPTTGAVTDGFRETFIRNRRDTFPPWADRSAFPGPYSLMTATHVPTASRGASLTVGDPVDLESSGS